MPPLPCVHPSLLALYVTNQWSEFHETLVDDAAEGTDELFGF